MREQGEGAITAVCTTLKLPMLSPAEIAFLSEYVKIMCPVAKAIDVLQGETNVQMGWLIPTITLLKTKLQHLRLSSKCCVPLIDALQSGLQKRFGEMLKDPELIAASILVPKFRRCWTTDEGLLQLGDLGLSTALALGPGSWLTLAAGQWQQRVEGHGAGESDEDVGKGLRLVITGR
uniref:Transposase n=1 Tax=Knipowitschia caucasica TaxID=637954 RepID=A0AAV2JKH7_KNICA